MIEFEVKTVVEMNWSGLKNGNLMKVAVEENFDVLLTIDKNLEFQQNIKNTSLRSSCLMFRKAKLRICWNCCRNSKNKLETLKKAIYI